MKRILLMMLAVTIGAVPLTAAEVKKKKIEKIRQAAQEAAQESGKAEKAATKAVEEEMDEMDEKMQKKVQQQVQDKVEEKMNKKGGDKGEDTPLKERVKAATSGEQPDDGNDKAKANSKADDSKKANESDEAAEGDGGDETADQKEQVKKIMKESKKAGPDKQPLASPIQSEKVSDILKQFSELENEFALLKKKLAVAKVRQKLNKIQASDKKAKKDAQDQGPGWRLASTSGAPGNMTATLYMKENHGTLQVETGDRLPGGWTITEIAPTFVAVSRENETRYHWLEGSGGAGQGKSKKADKLKGSIPSSKVNGNGFTGNN